MPTSDCQPIRFLDPDCWYKFTYWMANSADPDQLASSEANQISWLLQKPTDLGLHCLQRQCISWFSRTRVKSWPFYCLLTMKCLKIAGWVANNIDSEQIPHSVAAYLTSGFSLKNLFKGTHVSIYPYFRGFLEWFQGLIVCILQKILQILRDINVSLRWRFRGH